MEFASRPRSLASAALRRGRVSVLFLVAASLTALCSCWLVTPPNSEFRLGHVDLAGLNEAVPVAQTIALYPIQETFIPTPMPWPLATARPASAGKSVLAAVRPASDFATARSIPPAVPISAAWSVSLPAAFTNAPPVAAETLAAPNEQAARRDATTTVPRLVAAALLVTSAVDTALSTLAAPRIGTRSWLTIQPNELAQAMSPLEARRLPGVSGNVAIAALSGKTIGQPVRFAEGRAVAPLDAPRLNATRRIPSVIADKGHLTIDSPVVPPSGEATALAESTSTLAVTAIAYDSIETAAPTLRHEANWAPLREDGGDGKALDAHDLVAFPFLRRPEWTPLGIPDAMPMGYYELCKREPSVCQPSRGRLGWWSYERGMHLDSVLMKQLVAINAAVNHQIRQVSDFAQYHVADWWVVEPKSKAGDCEDFALTKKARLIAQGWPSSVLLVALAKTQAGVDHAVLIVRTDEGDLVLDSLRPGIREWAPTLYQWRSMQSPTNIWSWVAVGGEPAVATAFQDLSPVGDRQGASLALK